MLCAALASKSIQYKCAADEESETNAKIVSKAISQFFFPMHTPKAPQENEDKVLLSFFYITYFSRTFGGYQKW